MMVSFSQNGFIMVSHLQAVFDPNYNFHSSDVSIGFNPTAYMVQEGGSVELIIERMGDAEVAVVATVSTRDGSATGKY